MSLVDRTYVSRFSQPTFALEVYRAGVPGSADDDVSASLYLDGESVAEFTRVVPEGAQTGVYPITLSSADTANPGDYELRWAYEVDAVTQMFATSLEFGPSAPAYDALGAGWAGVIDDVWAQFADLFDSPFGGPNLQTYVQTKFGRNRLAQLLKLALQDLNNISNPHQSFEFDGDGFPFAQWGGLLQQALYVQVLKHLVRSYTEQPEVLIATAVSRVDRRDYMQRWNEVLAAEQAEFRTNLGRYKMAFLGLGNAHVLVSGGAFGKLGPYANAGGAGQAASRGYFAVRRWH